MRQLKPVLTNRNFQTGNDARLTNRNFQTINDKKFSTRPNSKEKIELQSISPNKKDHEDVCITQSSIDLGQTKGIFTQESLMNKVYKDSSGQDIQSVIMQNLTRNHKYIS
jgi:hypothetical protein